MTIYEVVMENEHSWRPEQETREGLLNIWKVMKECIYRGCHIGRCIAGRSVSEKDGQRH